MRIPRRICPWDSLPARASAAVGAACPEARFAEGCQAGRSHEHPVVVVGYWPTWRVPRESAATLALRTCLPLPLIIFEEAAGAGRVYGWLARKTEAGA